MRLLLLQFVAAFIGVSTQSPRYITDFIQTPAGVLAADTRVNFSCQAVVSDVSWLVGGVRLNESTSTAEFRILTRLNGNFTFSTLSTQAKSNENNTQVTCIAASSASSDIDTDNRTVHIVVAAPPLPPVLHLAIISNGSNLQARWNRPFTMSGFPVTSYTMNVVNKTSGQSIKVILDENLLEIMTYDLQSSSVPVSCHSLSFSVIATNAVGDSSASNIATSGFSIFPRTDDVIIHVDLNISADLPVLTATFQAPEVCTFQEPAIYTIGIFGEQGDEIILTRPMPANMSIVVEIIEAGLERGNLYSVELTIQHHQVPGEAFITFIGIDFSDTLDFTTTNTIIITEQEGHNCAVSFNSIPLILIISQFILL